MLANRRHHCGTIDRKGLPVCIAHQNTAYIAAAAATAGGGVVHTVTGGIRDAVVPTITDVVATTMYIDSRPFQGFRQRACHTRIGYRRKGSIIIVHNPHPQKRHVILQIVQRIAVNVRSGGGAIMRRVGGIVMRVCMCMNVCPANGATTCLSGRRRLQDTGETGDMEDVLARNAHALADVVFVQTDSASFSFGLQTKQLLVGDAMEAFGDGAFHLQTFGNGAKLSDQFRE